jgi:hypothetical protein
MSFGQGMDKLKFVRSQAQEKLDEAESQIGELLDSRVQLKSIASSVDQYARVTFKSIEGNEDMLEVSRMLATALASINAFINEAPSKTETRAAVLRERVNSFSYTNNLIDNALLDLEKQEKKHKDLKSKIESGEVDPTGRRKIGQRPEKLKNIRRVLDDTSEDLSLKNTEDDI